MTATDVVTGDHVEHPLAIPCEYVVTLRLSADGARVAFAYDPVDDPEVPGKPGTRLAVAEVATGDVVYDESIRGDDQQVLAVAVAWDGPTGLRVAVGESRDDATVDRIALPG